MFICATYIHRNENLCTCSWKLEYVAIIKASSWSTIFSDGMADRPDLNAEKLGRVAGNAVTSFLRPLLKAFYYFRLINMNCETIKQIFYISCCCCSWLSCQQCLAAYWAAAPYPTSSFCQLIYSISVLKHGNFSII